MDSNRYDNDLTTAAISEGLADINTLNVSTSKVIIDSVTIYNHSHTHTYTYIHIHTHYHTSHTHTHTHTHVYYIYYI